MFLNLFLSNLNLGSNNTAFFDILKDRNLEYYDLNWELKAYTARGKDEVRRVVSPQIQCLMKDQKGMMRGEWCKSLKSHIKEAWGGLDIEKIPLYKLAYPPWVNGWRNTEWVHYKGQCRPFQQHTGGFHRSLCQKWAAGKPIKLECLTRLPELDFHYRFHRVTITADFTGRFLHWLNKEGSGWQNQSKPSLSGLFVVTKTRNCFIHLSCRMTLICSTVMEWRVQSRHKMIIVLPVIQI